MERNSVLVVGSINYDFILRTDHLPQRGETLIAESFEICSGGKGANQAVQCAKLGINTYMAGAVGDDFMGTFLYESLRNYGVDISRVKIKQGTSGFAMANAAGDGNLFATIIKGTNDMVSIEDIDELDDIFPKCSVVIFQLEIPVETVEYAVSKAKQYDCTVIINTAPAKKISNYVLAMCDIIVMNEIEAQFYCNSSVVDITNAGKYSEKISSEFNNITIITLGENGSVISSKGLPAQHFSAYKVKAIETTGAGDAFIGGITYGFIYSMSLEQTIAFASCCSSITIQKPGGQPAMPTLEQVQTFLSQHIAQFQ